MGSRPRIGLAAIIIRDGNVLLGLRKSDHDGGTWCPPGGHLEHGESPEEGIKREVLEEIGCAASSVRFSTFTNDVFDSGKHYITLVFTCAIEGEPTVGEPEKCERWEWFDWDDQPEPLFTSYKNLVESGFRPE